MNALTRRHHWLPAILTIVLWIAGCAGLPPGAEPPTVTIAGIELASANLFEQQMNLKLRIQNPNQQAFEIDGISFSLEVNDQPFAKGVGNQAVVVPRYGSALMDVEAVSTLSSLIKQVGKLADRRELKYRITGTLSLAGGVRVPFDRRGEVELSGGAFRSK